VWLANCYFANDSSGFPFPATILRWAICSFCSQWSACHCTRRSSALSRVVGCQFRKSWSGRVDLNHRPNGPEPVDKINKSLSWRHLLNFGPLSDWQVWTSRSIQEEPFHAKPTPLTCAKILTSPHRSWARRAPGMQCCFSPRLRKSWLSTEQHVSRPFYSESLPVALGVRCSVKSKAERTSEWSDWILYTGMSKLGRPTESPDGSA